MKYVLQVHVHLFSQLLFVHINLFIKKYLLLEKGMVATLMFQCTSFQSDKIVSNQILVMYIDLLCHH